ncbi:MAG: DNA/RNA nuclease SfsA [Clostridiales bacterium]|nr:DNA/RNA nuclease SfsA [Clostridiales bacterium]
MEKNDILINIDSQAPNKAAKEWLASGGLGFVPDYLKAEYTYEDSRFDFYLEYQKERWLIEVSSYFYAKYKNAA